MSTSQPVRALVVDDDIAMGHLIGEIFRAEGMEVISLSDSREAAVRLSEQKFHAFFLDMRMPPPDGIELVRLIRASRWNASAVVVMITGESDQGVLGRAFQAGADFCLFKPVETSSLRRLLRVTQASIDRVRRRAFRVPLRLPVGLELGAQRIEGSTVDLSLGGMLVQTQEVFPEGSTVKVNLGLTPDSSLLCYTARVVRKVGKDRMAVHIESLEAKEGIRLQDFLMPLILAAMKQINPMRSVR